MRRVYVHRLVVEQAIGRTLQPTEIVHHINGNAADNCLDNLIVLSSQSAHMFLHHYIWRKEQGAGQLFSPLDVVRIAGEDVIWGTKVGLQQVFGVEACVVLEKLQTQGYGETEAKKYLRSARRCRPELRGTDGYRKWFSAFKSQILLPSVPAIASRQVDRNE